MKITTWIADAHRGDGKRFVVHADEKLTAFLEPGISGSRLRRVSLTDGRDFSKIGVAKRI
jgi:hypothetical protein